MTKKIHIGISSCPNDTFMFDAIYNQRIAPGDVQFEFTIADIEELNQLAMHGKLDIVKISFNAYTRVSDHYQLLDSGSALGRNCGPLIIARQATDISDLTPDMILGIPGWNTTANLLASIAFPSLDRKKELLFSKIEEAVLDGTIDLGLIIHESRFTYRQKGLHQVVDLGVYWESISGRPIPLGGIAIRRSLPPSIKMAINDLVHKSILYAFDNPADSIRFIKSHAQEMKDEVIQKHIELYVNEYSINLGQKGKGAIEYLYQKMHEMEILGKKPKNIFL